ncbi:MAG: hypothetical protein EOO87_07945 [Pedobacter sp.]|nr:MAG: hypothetical protein EOO87_07945 [Pedobacter sp.]
MKLAFTLLFSLFFVSAFAQTSKTKAPEFALGNFTDDYKITYTVNDTLWIQHPNTKYHIIKWNPELQYLIAKNDANNKADANKYTRIDYMTFTGMEPFKWGFCLTVYKFLKISLIFLVIVTSVKAQQTKDYTKFVNPFIGTGGHGHTYPGPALPFGMIQPGPDTRLDGWDGCSGYHYSDNIIYGFSQTHLSGTGIEDYCDFLFMPTTGKPQLANKEYASPFQKKNEKASPGYYSTFLDKYQIKAEITTSKRAGLYRFTYPKTVEANIIIDLKHRDKVLDSWIEIVNGQKDKSYIFMLNITSHLKATELQLMINYKLVLKKLVVKTLKCTFSLLLMGKKKFCRKLRYLRLTKKVP